VARTDEIASNDIAIGKRARRVTAALFATRPRFSITAPGLELIYPGSGDRRN